MSITDAGVDVPKTDELADKLKVEEFKILRGEIELRATEQRSMERNVILIAAATYGFLLTPKTGISQDDIRFVNLAWYLPAVFSFLALLRWRESVKMIDALADYLRGVEQKAVPGGGWETFLAQQRAKNHLPIASGWYALFWVITVVGLLVIAYIRQPVFTNYVKGITVLIAVVSSLIVVVFVLRRRRA